MHQRLGQHPYTGEVGNLGSCFPPWRESQSDSLLVHRHVDSVVARPIVVAFQLLAADPEALCLLWY